jgi:hypothetical protein
LTSAFIIDCDMDVSFAARIIRVQSDKIAAFHGRLAERARHPGTDIHQNLQQEFVGEDSRSNET